MKILIAAFALSMSTAAIAQTTEYYVVRDATAKKCMVVDKKPETTTTTITVVGNNTIYKTRTEAETAMKSVTVCSEM